MAGNITEDGSGVAWVRVEGNLAVITGNDFEYELTLSEGPNQPEITCADLAGNLADPEQLDTIILDTQAPTMCSVSIAAGDYTRDLNVELSLSATDPEAYPGFPGSGVENMQFSSDGTNYTAFEDYNETRDWVLTAGDGTKTVYVRFQDEAGNLSEAFSASIVLDQTNPTGSISINQGSQYTNNRDVTLTLSATDDLSSVSHMQIRDGSGDSGVIAYVASRSWSLSAGDGAKTVFVRFQDGAGNWSEESAISDEIILDTTPPASPTVTSVEPALVRKGADDYTRAETLTISGTKEANASVLIGSDEVVAVDELLSWSAEVSLTEGRNLLSITSRDLAGNSSTPLMLNVIVKKKINFTVIQPNKKFFKKNDPDLMAGTKDIMVLYTIDDETEIKMHRATLSEGDNTVTLTAEDFLGNSGEHKLSIGLDTAPPAINISSHQDGEELDASPITFTGTVTDATSGVASVKINGVEMTLSANSFSANINLSDGANNIVVEAEDNAGNTATASLTLNYALPAAEADEEEAAGSGAPIYVTPLIVDMQEIAPEEEALDIYEEEEKKVTKKKVIQPRVYKEAPVIREPVRREEPYEEYWEPEPTPQVIYREARRPKIVLREEEQEERIIKKAIKRAPKIEMPEATIEAKLIKRFLLWRVYKLNLQGTDVQPLYWTLKDKKQLPFWMRLNRRGGAIYGFAWKQKTLKLDFVIITRDGEQLELPCLLEIN